MDVTGISGVANAASQVVGAATGIAGLFGPSHKKRTERQISAQKQMNEDAAQINFGYGEQAAENAYERQLGMYDSRLSPEQQIKSQMKGLEDNGLSVGLMYGGSGPGGSGSASTAPQGQGASGQQGGRAANAAEQQMARNQSLSIALNAARQTAEIENIKADTEQKKAQTTTEDTKRELFLENLKQEGLTKWLENIKTQWEMEGEKDAMTIYKNKQYGDTAIIPNGYYGQQMAADIAQAWGNAHNIEALAKLNANKAEGYFQELLNATSQADSAAAHAAAHKLEAEWKTGEGMNWNSWMQVAKDILIAIMR